MRATALLYHDLVEAGKESASGFPGAAASMYKMEFDLFRRHIACLHEHHPDGPRLIGGDGPSEHGFYLTFDDGGASNIQAAEILATYGWKAHFFVTTDMIGQPAFLDPDSIRELDRMGHVIGSHSCSHPRRMSDLTLDELRAEWSDSKAALEEILGHPVNTASIPGGFYSKSLAMAASNSGVRHLFTSEPVKSTWRIGDCELYGRYNLWCDMQPDVALGLASDQWIHQFRQFAWWNTKKIAKKVAGPVYAQLRHRLANR